MGEYVFEILEIRSNRIESVLMKSTRADADARQAAAESTEPAADVAPGDSPDTDTGTPSDPGQPIKED